MSTSSPRDLIREGLALVERRQYASARPLFEAAVRLAPDNCRARFCLGAALYHLGDMEGALQQWQRVRAIDPGYANVEHWIDAATQQAALHDPPAGGEAPPFA